MIDRQDLIDVGHYLHNINYINGLALDLGVTPRTVRRWIKHETAPDRVREELIGLLDAKIMDGKKLKKVIDSDYTVV